MVGKQMYGIAKSGEHAGEYTRCRAKDPNTCRYHVPGSHVMLTDEDMARHNERIVGEQESGSSMALSKNAVAAKAGDMVKRLDGMPVDEAYRVGLDELGQLDDPDDKRHDALRTAVADYKSRVYGDDSKHVDYVEIFSGIQEADGGATWDPRTKESPISGFCVSPYPERGIVLEHYDDDVELILVLDKFQSDNDDLFSQPDNYIGLWNNPEDGKVYLDVSKRVSSAEEARSICENNEQIAFFDLQTFNSVESDIGKTANTARSIINDNHLDHGDARISNIGGNKILVTMTVNGKPMDYTIPVGANREEITDILTGNTR